MAGSATNVGEKIALDAVTGRATQSARTMYLALLTAAPTDSTTMATMSEVTTPGTNGYSRQTATFTDPGTSGATSLASAVTFGPFTADLGSVTHVALVSASTGTSGDLVYFWELDTARDPASGDSVRLAAGTCEIDAN